MARKTSKQGMKYLQYHCLIDSIVDRHIFVWITTITLIAFCNKGLSYSGKTHQSLTYRAIVDNGQFNLDSYIKDHLGIPEGLSGKLNVDQSAIPEVNRIPNDQLEKRISEVLPQNPTILDLFKSGTELEDVPNPRARHHFHAPIANPGVTPLNPNSGLDNKTDHPEISEQFDKMTKLRYLWGYDFDLTGASCLDRARNTEGAQWEDSYKNYFSWPDARDYFYKALEERSELARKHYFALTFLTAGHVLHLLEDMGVPAHTRNDFISGHYRSWYDHGNPFETWIEEQVEENYGQCPWSGSGPVAFDELSKYFDANEYLGDYLGDGGLPPTTWGLSESSNYQFLSLSTMFGCTGTKYQFPNPAKEHLGTDLIVPVTEGKKIYFNGSNYGVSHIARKSYTQYFADEHGIHEEPINNTNTTDDVNVFEDYANITIPRTINYATGLLNYFFRGKLDIEPNCLDCETVTFKIRNISENSNVHQTLKGGMFELFWDDHDGNRTKINDFIIPGWTPNSILDFNQQVTGTFTRPESNEIETYTVVYKGQINENPAQPDEDDDEAIAVAALRMGYPIIAWGDDTDGIVSNIPDGNDFIEVAAGKYHALAIRSSGSLVAWGWNSYGQCNVPEGNDFIAIAGGVRHSIALKSDGSLVGWGDNGSGQIDVPEGDDYVAIAAGDYHNLAITADGLIVGWGRNYSGECDAPAPDTGTTYVAVSAGKYHTLALQSDGTIKAWGSNTMGQTTIYYGADDDHEAIAACDDYNFLLLEDDMLVSWGGGDFVEPGRPDYHYRQPDENDFVAIAAGTLHILALTADGRILLWGYNDYDSPPPPISPVPDGVVFTKDVAAGWKFSVALKTR